MNPTDMRKVGMPEKPDYRKLVTYRTTGKYGTFWGARIVCTSDDPEQQKLCKWYEPHPKAGQKSYYKWCRYNYDVKDDLTDECVGGISFGPLPEEAPG